MPHARCLPNLIDKSSGNNAYLYKIYQHLLRVRHLNTQVYSMSLDIYAAHLVDV